MLAGCPDRCPSPWVFWPAGPAGVLPGIHGRTAGPCGSIGDGDTLRVQQGSQRLTIPLACIDAPEMAQRPHGPKAREYLRLRLPIGRPVTLKIQTTDRYGRTVTKVVSEMEVGVDRYLLFPPPNPG